MTRGFSAVFHPGGGDRAVQALAKLDPGAFGIGGARVSGDPDAAGARVLGSVSNAAVLDDVATTETGARGAKRLAGAYSLAFPCQDGGLVVARGALGGKPLYVRHVEGAIFFSTSLPRLQRLGPVTPDLERLAAYIAGVGVTDRSRTFFREIQRVFACEIWAVRPDGTIRKSRRAIPNLRSQEGAAPELAEGLRDHVGRAVAAAPKGHRLVALSGGLDSSILLWEALRLARDETTAASMDVAGLDRAHAEELARAFGIELRWVTPGRDPSPLASGIPHPHASLPLERALLIAAKRMGLRLLVTGTGGDEVFGGDKRFFARALLQDPPDAFRRIASLKVPWDAGKWTDLALRPSLRRGIPSRVLRARGALRHGRDLPFVRPKVQHALAFERWGRSYARGSEDPVERYVALAEWGILVDYADAQGLLDEEHGVSRIDPLLSDDLVRFTSSLPLGAFWVGDRHRGLARMAYRGRLPESVRLRDDKAEFRPEVDAWHAAHARDHAPLENLSHLRDAGLISEVGSPRGEFGPYYSWTLLSAEAFLAQTTGRSRALAW